MARLLALLLVLAAGAAHAERFEAFGDYQVHYNAIPSSFLDPEQARAAGVLRSRVRGVLVVTVRNAAGPVAARVDGQLLDTKGKATEIALRELREGAGVSYIGGFPLKDGETHRFEIVVRPAGSDAPLRLRFSQALYSE